jgi:hypothetical protein
MTAASGRPTPPPPGDVSSWRLSTALSAGQLVWGVLLVGAWLALVWPARTDPDYTAGEILDNTMAWSESGRLYSPIDHTPYRVFNYPPAFPAAVRLLMAAGLAPLPAGRLLTVASIVIVVLLTYRWLRDVGCDRGGAVLALSLFASSFPLVFYVGQFHLQWAAVAASLFGCYLLRAPTSAARAALAGGSLALACLFKQTQIWSLVVMAVWVLAHQRHALRAFATASVAVAALGVAVVLGVFGAEAWLHLVTYTVGTFSFRNLVQLLRIYVAPWTLPFVFGLWIAARGPAGRRDVRFWYFAGSSLGLLSAARSGAGPQYLIEWSIATVLWIGPSIQELLRTPQWRGWVVAVLAAHLVLGDAITAERLFVRGVRLRQTELALPALCAALPADAPTPIESAAVARACGRAPALHPFIMTNLAERGLWDERPFVQDIARGAFAVIVLPFDFRDGRDRPSRRWTQAMLTAVRQRYRLAEEHNGWRVFRPLQSAEAR